MALMSPESSVVVPYGWLREVEGSLVYYMSPDNRKLNNMEEVLQHLLTPGTCKCGLRCPIDVKKDFSFDPEVIPLPTHFETTAMTRVFCKKPHRARSSSSSSDTENKTVPESKTASPSSKAIGTKRSIASFSLSPEVRLGKMLKFGSLRANSLSTKSEERQELGSTKPVASKRSKSRNAKQAERDKIMKSKNKLLSLLKKTSAMNSSHKDTPVEGGKSNPPIVSSGSPAPKTSPVSTPTASLNLVFTSATSTAGDARKAYSNLQEILKQAKLLSLSKEGQKPLLWGTDSSLSSPTTPMDADKRVAPEQSTNNGKSDHDLSSPDDIIQTAHSLFSGMDSSPFETGTPISDKSRTTATSLCDRQNSSGEVSSVAIEQNAVASISLNRPATETVKSNSTGPTSPPAVRESEQLGSGLSSVEPNISSLVDKLPPLAPVLPRVDNCSEDNSVPIENAKEVLTDPMEASSTRNSVCSMTDFANNVDDKEPNSDLIHFQGSVSAIDFGPKDVSVNCPKVSQENSSLLVKPPIDKDDEIEELLRELLPDLPALENGHEAVKLDRDNSREAVRVDTEQGLLLENRTNKLTQESQQMTLATQLGDQINSCAPLNQGSNDTPASAADSSSFRPPAEKSSTPIKESVCRGTTVSQHADSVRAGSPADIPVRGDSVRIGAVVGMETDTPTTTRNGDAIVGTETDTPTTTRNGDAIVGTETDTPTTTRNGDGIVGIETDTPNTTRNGDAIEAVETDTPTTTRNGDAIVGIETDTPNTTRNGDAIEAVETDTPTTTRNGDAIVGIETDTPNTTRNGDAIEAVETDTPTTTRNGDAIVGIETDTPNTTRNGDAIEAVETDTPTTTRNGDAIEAMETDTPTTTRNGDAIEAMETDTPTTTRNGDAIEAVETDTPTIQNQENMSIDTPTSPRENMSIDMPATCCGDSTESMKMDSPTSRNGDSLKSIKLSYENSNLIAGVMENINEVSNTNKNSNGNVEDCITGPQTRVESSPQADHSSCGPLVDGLPTCSEVCTEPKSVAQNHNSKKFEPISEKVSPNQAFNENHQNDCEDSSHHDTPPELLVSSPSSPLNTEQAQTSVPSPGDPDTNTSTNDVAQDEALSKNQPECGAIDEQIVSSAQRAFSLLVAEESTESSTARNAGTPPTEVDSGFSTTDNAQQNDEFSLDLAAGEDADTNDAKTDEHDASNSSCNQESLTASITELNSAASSSGPSDRTSVSFDNPSPLQNCASNSGNVADKATDIGDNTKELYTEVDLKESLDSLQAQDSIKEPQTNLSPDTPVDQNVPMEVQQQEGSRVATEPLTNNENTMDTSISKPHSPNPEHPESLEVQQQEGSTEPLTNTMETSISKPHSPNPEYPESQMDMSPVIPPVVPLLDSKPPELPSDTVVDQYADSQVLAEPLTSSDSAVDTPISKLHSPNPEHPKSHKATSFKTAPLEPLLDSKPPELPLDTVVHQFDEDDKSSGSAIVTSSAQYRSGTPFSSVTPSSPLTSVASTHGDGSESLLSASHSSILSLKSSVSGTSSELTPEEMSLPKEPTKEPTDCDYPSLASRNGGGRANAGNEVTDSVVNHSELAAEPNGLHLPLSSKVNPHERKSKYMFQFKKSYPTRSKFRSQSTRLEHSSGSPTSGSSLGKRRSSASSDLKSPGSEASSVVDSVFEGELPGNPKKQKKSNVVKPRSKQTRCLTVSIPRSSARLREEGLPSESLGRLCVGTIVWAKAPMLPGWPGRIMSHRERRGMAKPPRNKVWVQWFGGSTISLVDTSSVKSLEEGIVKASTSKKNSKQAKKLELAIAEAQIVLQAQQSEEGI